MDLRLLLRLARARTINVDLDIAMKVAFTDVLYTAVCVEFMNCQLVSSPGHFTLF